MQAPSPSSAALDLSVVIPVYNEEDSLPTLVSELHDVLRPVGISYEIVLIDDGSTDGSYATAKRMASIDPALTLVRFRRNFGQTAAMQAGLDTSRGKVIVTMDADLQNDPSAIPAML